MNTPRRIYCIDSSALIHGWRRAYRPKNFGHVWDQMDDLIEEGRLKASIEIFHELEKKDDELLEWCKARKDNLFVEIDDDCQTHVSRILGTYPRLIDTAKGRSGGDPFVIALAALRPPMIVVTQEYPQKQSIPIVCRSEKIECIDLADMIEAEDWQFKKI